MRVNCLREIVSLIIKRLNIQHEYLKKHVYDGKLIYDADVAEKLRNGGRVLDNGTGTGRFLAPNYHADADDEKRSRVGAGAIAGSSENMWRSTE